MDKILKNYESKKKKKDHEASDADESFDFEDGYNIEEAFFQD